MTDRLITTGAVNATPEGGPVQEGTPATAPGAGQVRLTPEGGPLSEQPDTVLHPPTWQEHMKGPILGLDDRETAASKPVESSAAQTPPPPAADRTPPPPYAPLAGSGRTAEDDEELKKWPPYTGKPVSDVQDAWRYAAPVVSQAEKLTISALGLAGSGLTKLAGFLEQRRLGRSADEGKNQAR